MENFVVSSQDKLPLQIIVANFEVEYLANRAGMETFIETIYLKIPKEDTATKEVFKNLVKFLREFTQGDEFEKELQKTLKIKLFDYLMKKDAIGSKCIDLIKYIIEQRQAESITFATTIKNEKQELKKTLNRESLEFVKLIDDETIFRSQWVVFNIPIEQRNKFFESLGQHEGLFVLTDTSGLTIGNDLQVVFQLNSQVSSLIEEAFQQLASGQQIIISNHHLIQTHGIKEVKVSHLNQTITFNNDPIEYKLLRQYILYAPSFKYIQTKWIMLKDDQSEFLVEDIKYVKLFNGFFKNRSLKEHTEAQLGIALKKDPDSLENSIIVEHLKDKAVKKAMLQMSLGYWNKITTFSYKFIEGIGSVSEKEMLMHKVKVVPLQPSSYEYGYLSHLFLNGNNTGQQSPAMGLFITSDTKNFTIKDISKIYNTSVYTKFTTECQRQIYKHNAKLTFDQMFKLLFHGSNGTKPELIYESEDGLDIRFSRNGLFGQGLYFAKDPNYSHIYASKVSSHTYQMFVCLVALGQYKSYSQSGSDTANLRLPPLLEQSQGSPLRYDSVYNKSAKHYIVYDNAKVYPGYLITYTDI